MAAAAHSGVAGADQAAGSGRQHPAEWFVETFLSAMLDTGCWRRDRLPECYEPVGGDVLDALREAERCDGELGTGCDAVSY